MKGSGPRKTILTAIATLILLGIATSPLTSIFVVRRLAASIVNDSIVGLATSGQASINISDGLLETSMALGATNQGQLKEFSERLSASTAETDRQFKKYESAIYDAADRANFETLIKRRTEYREIRKQIFDLLSQERRADAVALFNGRCLTAFNDYLHALGVVVKYNSQEAADRGEQILKLTKGMLILQSLLVVFFIVYAFWIPALTLYERLTRRAIED